MHICDLTTVLILIWQVIQYLLILNSVRIIWWARALTFKIFRLDVISFQIVVILRWFGLNKNAITFHCSHYATVLINQRCFVKNDWCYQTKIFHGMKVSKSNFWRHEVYIIHHKGYLWLSNHFNADLSQIRAIKHKFWYHWGYVRKILDGNWRFIHQDCFAKWIFRKLENVIFSKDCNKW